jgi:hypothetical protein
MTRRVSKIFLSIFLLSVFLFPLSGLKAQAGNATLFLSPSTGSYNLNKTFVVKVMVDSGEGLGINAAEGNIKFNNSLLSVSRVDDSNSVFTLWTTDPTFSNGAGTISFGGGSPGAYKGSAGEIFSITFKTKALGTAEVKFTSGIILAADGKGTNVFGGFGNGLYIVKEVELVKPKETTKSKLDEGDKPKGMGIRPPLPEIESLTHPEENVWYSNNDPEFKWKLLADLSGVSFLIDQENISDPGNTADGIIESKIFEDILDGENYFHIKYGNSSGWGPIGHKKFLVDITPPKKFSISLDTLGDATNPTPRFMFVTTDETSGIEYFSININDQTTRINPNEVVKGYYQPEPLKPGEYNVQIIAVDRAENKASSTINFIVDPLKAPIITSIPKILNKKDELIIQGTSFYPNVTVKIYIEMEGKDPIEASVRTDDAGNWSYFHKGDIDKGNYEVWAKLIDERGAESLDSTRYLMSVVSPSIVCEYGIFIIIFLLIIIILLILYIVYLKNTFNEEKIRIKRETEEVKNKLSKIFAALRDEVDELIQLADKKPGLSESERRVKEKLQESLDISEEFIAKEVDDVEKEIKISKKKVKE